MNIDEGKETLDWTHEIWPLENYKQILYVGIHPKTFNVWGGDYFLNRIEQHTKTSCVIVEINKVFINELEDHPVTKKHNISFIHSSIQDYVATTNEQFDCIIWWHGPEHLPKEESLKIIRSFEKICPNGIIILGCPEGHQPYEDGEDRHHWDVYQKDFQELGYETILCDRTKSYPGSLPSISARKKT